MDDAEAARSETKILSGTHAPPESEREQALVRIEDRLEAAQHVVGLPRRYRGCTLANFEVQRQPAAYDKARGFVDGDRQKSLVFWGAPGLGKTHLAAAVVNEILRESPFVTGIWRKDDMNGVVCFLGFDDALRRLRQTYEAEYSGVGEGWLLRRWAQVPVLVLDEVGQRGRETVPKDFVRQIGYELVDGRYREVNRPLIITTNRDPGELSNWITPAGVDRLFQMGDFVEFTGESYRLHGATGCSVEANPMEAVRCQKPCG